MVRKTLIFLALFLIIPAAALAAPLMVISQPKITLKDPILEGSVAKGEFQIINQGDSDLVIKNVSPG